MTKQITLEEALKLVSFINLGCLGWRVHDVKGDVKGNVHGSIGRNVYGDMERIALGIYEYFTMKYKELK